MLQNFEQWAARVRNKYNYIPSLKGKKAFTNLFILYQLAIKPESSWDLALDYLKTVRAGEYAA